MNEFMEMALLEAEKARKREEVPIGAVVVKNGKVIAKGFNKREKTKSALNHAEIVAIRKACRKLKDWRLEGCEIYVTLKPCPMCAGAIANARIDKVYYGADETNTNDNLAEQIFASTRLNHKVEMEKLDAYSEKCAQMLSAFFRSKR